MMVAGSAEDLSLAELRARRAGLQHTDDAVSFVRRLAQAKLDMVRAQQRHLRPGSVTSELITDELPQILGTHLTGGAARPPRPADDFSDHALAGELSELEQRHGGLDIAALDAESLEAFATALDEFERQRSVERRALFAEIDALSAELVRRYRSGEADVGALLAAD